MPSFEVMDLYQVAVYWPLSGLDRYGEPTTATPQEIPCRWVQTNTQATTPQGETIGIEAKITTTVHLIPDSLVWLGTLDDWYVSGSGSDDTMLMQVKALMETPDIKARNTRHDYGLTRFRAKQGED